MDSYQEISISPHSSRKPSGRVGMQFWGKVILGYGLNVDRISVKDINNL